MSTEALGTLDASEQAYFENGGETPIEEGSTSTNEAEQTTATDQGSEQPEHKTEETSKEPKTVPLAALHEERQRRREQAERLRALEEQTRVGNERLQQLAAMVTQRQQPQIPEFEQDPATNMNARLAQIEQMAQQQVRAQQEQAQRQAAMNHLQAELSAQEQEYRQVNPDYDNAVKYLGEVEVRSLMALGYSQQAASQMVQNQFGAMAWELRRQGQDVPSRVYEFAKARGYAQAPAVSPQDKISTAQKGVQASRTLGSGGQVKSNLDLAALASMPADEFDALTKDPKAWRALMGG